MSSKVSRFLPSIIWMLTIFYFSSRPTTGIGHTPVDRFLILKSLHLAEYAFLFILLFFGFRHNPKAFFSAYLFALTDEYHQSFIPGRQGRFSDTLIDLIGIFLGYLFLRYFLKKLNHLPTTSY